MRTTLISTWGRQMQRALLIYFRNHGVPAPDPTDLACLTAIGVTQIDRDNLGFKSTTFLGVASLLVPALLDPRHRLHDEITTALQACKGQSAAARTGMRTGATESEKPRGSLAHTVTLEATTKLPGLGKMARAHAQFAKTKAVPKRRQATAARPRPR